ncbi:MAG: toxic anion resistance protein, partial [Lachnospiraceae bacterium]|nr:toxic anion resistance protein [Lachnospiraceae bacterium]
PEEREMVDQFASEINIENVEQVVNYGMQAQTNISDFSTDILKKVKTYDLGDIGDSLKELTIALDATTEPEKRGIFGVFQKAKRGAGSIRANYAKAESNVDRIEKDLQRHITVLTQDISMYQQMYDLNMQYYRELTMYIIAGKKALAVARNGKLQELKAKAEETTKQEDVQEYRDYEDLCHRFEKKLADLEITRVISIQSAPQVRMLQNNDREMLDKLQSSLANTIPLWRNQLVLSLGIEHTSRALDAQSALTNKTNDLLKKNSETLKMATIETAKQSEQPIVDVAVLHQCNKDLISSINEVVKVHEQGTVQREKSREELVKIEEELKQAMLEAKGGR